MKSLLYLSSITILLFTGFYVIQENIFAEWRDHQLNYCIQLEVLNKEKIDADIFHLKLRQIYIPEMNRVDRCITCHIPIEDPRFIRGKNPLKEHPGNYLVNHDVDQFGCTICHDGQGRAICWEDAAADRREKHWEKPILREPFWEANCYRCHYEMLQDTPVYNRGKQIFETSGCLCCHQRDGIGGYLGTELRGLSDESLHKKYPTDKFDYALLDKYKINTNIAYIYESIGFPKAQPEDSVMFDKDFSHEETLALTVYLKSLTQSTPYVLRPVQPPEKPLPLLEKGKSVFQLICCACHGENGQGGVKNKNYIKDVIPTLNDIAERMFLDDKEEAEATIRAIEKFGDLDLADPIPDISRFNFVLARYKAIHNLILQGNPGGKKNPEGPQPFNMPSWKNSISEKDIPAVISYLVSLYDFEEEL